MIINKHLLYLQRQYNYLDEYFCTFAALQDYFSIRFMLGEKYFKPKKSLNPLDGKRSFVFGEKLSAFLHLIYLLNVDTFRNQTFYTVSRKRGQIGKVIANFIGLRVRNF